MGNDHHGHIHLRKGFDDLQHLACQLRVERRSRLIKKEHLRVQHQRTRNRNPLTLTAGKLTRIRLFFSCESHFLQQLFCLCFHLRTVAFLHMNRRIAEVFHHIIMWKQVEALEYHSKVFLNFPQHGRLCINGFSILHGDCLLAKIRQVTAIHRLQHRRTPQQRRFSRSRRADDREHLALFYFEGNIF